MNPRKIVLSLTVAAAAIVGFCALSTDRVRAQAADSGLATLLPRDAMTIVGVDMARLRNTSAYAYLEARQSSGVHGRLDMLAALTGFDLRRDIDSLLAAVVDKSSGSFEGAQYLAAAQGAFDVARLEAMFAMQEMQERQHRGFRIFDFADRARSDRGPQSGSVVFLDNQTALFGTPDLLIAALDRRLGGGPSLADNQSLLRRAESLSASNQVWIVSERLFELIGNSAPEGLRRGRPRLAGILGAVQDSTVAINFSNGIDLEAVSRFGEADAARNLADALRGLLAFAQLSRSEGQPMLPVLRNLQVTDQNQELTVSVRLDQAEFEQLIRSLDSGRTSGIARLD